MLRSVKEIMGYSLEAEDGAIGACNDFLIDEKTWGVRYMVADTRRWLPGRKVLVSPIALGDPDWAGRTFPVRLTQEQIREAPGLDEHAPVTRQYEIWYHRHYQWPFYWTGTGLWASGIHPRSLYVQHAPRQEDTPEIDRPHVHSVKNMIGYAIAASDGDIGHLDDLIIDDDNWSVRHAVAATRDWLPGKRVLVPTPRLKRVVWDRQRVEVDLSREQIKESPDYDPAAPVNREMEERIYDFVGRPHDWGA